MNAISITNISYVYPGAQQPALDQVSLHVSSGELLCLVGPSGCGKTTLLKLISGLIRPSEGTIHFDKTDVTATPPETRKAVMVFQSYLLFPFMSVLDNVGFALRMQNVPVSERQERSREMLGRVQLSGYEARKPASLSAGQRQRVALARALIAEPAVLLLDEPLSNLDRHLREDMRQVIIELQRETRVTTVCVTHDQEEAVLLGDRIAMISAGRLIQAGTAQDFYERPASVEVARFFGNNNVIEGRASAGLVTTALGSFTYDPSQAIGDIGLPGGTNDTATQRQVPVCIHIRPESIQMGPPCDGGANCISARVLRRVYVGTHVRYVVDVAGHSWRIVTNPATQDFQEGDAVSLFLPEDRIWLTRP